jgi:hypothetical protein
VPPPPVEGAAVGYALADGLDVADAVGDVVAVAVAVAGTVAAADVVGDVVEPAGGLAVVLGETLAGLLLGTAVDEAEPVTDGVKMAGVVVDEVAEQAESTTQARMTETPQPTAASRTPSTVPAMVARAFMEPPDGSGGWRIRFPIPAPETASEQKSAWPASTAPRCHGVFSIGILGYASRTTWRRRGTELGGAGWRRVAGFRVVVSWPQSGYAPPPTAPRSLRARVAGVAGVLLLMGGIATVGVAISAQVHAPQPSLAASGAIGSSARLSLPRSLPVSVDIPAIGVTSRLLHLGVNSDGSIQVPSLETSAAEAAWYKYSATPGQIGASVIEGHVDSYQGPAVFFRLGALHPGDMIDVRLADGVTAIFKVTGVRQYPKSRFPAKAIYQAAGYAALRLITCGGAFDYATSHYLSSTVVFASLISSRPARAPAAA